MPNSTQDTYNQKAPIAASNPIQSDFPPIPDFQSNQNSPPTSVKAANFFPPGGSSSSTKKFGGKKLVATILGVLLLIAGISTGVVLILQPQLLKQQAATTTYFCSDIMVSDCINGCVPDATGGHCKTTCLPGGSGCGGANVGNGGKCTTTLDCASGRGCWNGTCQTNQGSTNPCYLPNVLNKGKCVPPGNCQNNTATGTTGRECYVTTQIGVSANGTIGKLGTTICDGPHWTTCSPGYACVTTGSVTDCLPVNTPKPPTSSPPKTATPKPTPTKTPTPKPTPTRTPTPTPTRTPTPTPTRTPTPTPTRTPTKTPTPTPVPKCNSTCTTNANCTAGMVCYKPGEVTTGNCRNNSCLTNTNCVCATVTPTPTPKITPTPPGPNAVCASVKAYDSGWSQLSGSQLSALKPGNNINFCVAGTSSAGAFDMGRFTINGVAQNQTTTKRPGTNDYCQSYTIPSGVTTFTITAQIHHVSLGWLGP